MLRVEGLYALNAADTRKWAQTEQPSPTVPRPDSVPAPPTREEEQRNNQTTPPPDEAPAREDRDD